MPDANPCLNCGACCAYFRVSFYWGECVSGGGLVPDELVTQISPSRVAMLGTEARKPRCTALKGEVGEQVSCSIYHQRSSPCREFAAAWVDDEPNERCDAARAAFGLAPLEPEQKATLVPIAV
ncbi:ferredoxin [Pseudomonas agarici]|uniref:Ferredoxin n=1 Tax=Pseudomonas agarici TaxID=46677 RepID=A0A0X1T193_PSEAA|nr:YkgJ family cysteine cluster protein [Pseudomonas agarici]AMB85828.1 ferredoxin [Pseudomonas agarici]NWB89870.1 YkgJ family cysteine cluster protein [Pseudomonas agarici]NWC07318.1 YkgJ family cysteine cluster protein [Pseudomonas agarici]SEK48433.1 hypothetical protein SAMN05216604_103234 [Pseudomonas agarici]